MESWKAIEQQALSFSSRQHVMMRSSLSTNNITLDFKIPGVDAETYSLLFKLAEECQLQQKIENLFSGKPVNTIENRPALHSALRAFHQDSIWVDNQNVIPQIKTTLNAMRDMSDQIRSKHWYGYSGKPVTDVVNIGIGGSHLGPYFCVHALSELATPELNCHFISDISPLSFTQVTANLNPETTLFIVSSKSFTTIETLYNLKKAMDWLNHPNALEKHIIAITAHAERAQAFGIHHILPIWDWVGGRFSVCSAINLMTCIAIGFNAFLALLRGAESMDEHFRRAPWSQNLPIHLALLGIWNNNFLKVHELLLLVYAQNLDYFVPYIQQLDMESNGKSIDQYGRAVNYATGPIIWGGAGSQAQHSYYQLLCQGTHHIAADLISVDAYAHSPIHHLCNAQKEVLSTGRYDEDDAYGYIRGDAAINHLRLKDTSPETIGALIALYEHKIYVQSVIWQINAFDQPGVESSKRLMRRSLELA